MTREEAYRLVQELSMKCWNEGRDFKEAVEKSREIGKYIDPDEIDELFDPEYYLRNVDPIFKRILDGG
jgi:adenylosuccinate lyase